MDTEQILTVMGLVLVLASGGVGIYEAGDTVIDHSFLKEFVNVMPTDVSIIRPTADVDGYYDYVDVVTKSRECDYMLVRIEQDEAKIKCGYRIATRLPFPKLEHYRTYGEDMWVTDNRKSSKIKIYRRDNPDGGFDIVYTSST